MRSMRIIRTIAGIITTVTLFSCGTGGVGNVTDDAGNSITTSAVTTDNEELYGDKKMDEIVGLDKFLGAQKCESIVVKATADTYVEDGASANRNFSSSEELDFKASTTVNSAYVRKILMSFDISAFKEKEVSSVMLVLYCNSVQKSGVSTRVNVYDCTNDWDASAVTYKTMPKKGGLAGKTTVSSKGTVLIDVTEYIVNSLREDKSQVSFFIEGVAADNMRLRFDSLESEKNVPQLKANIGELNFSTVLDNSNGDAFTVAMNAVQTWFKRLEFIKNQGDDNAQKVKKNTAEYRYTVHAASKDNTNGASTKYTSYNTRLLSSVKNFAAADGESSLYDVYGGYMGGERYESTGYFYTRKIGDRWWTIDPLGYPYYRVACVTVVPGGSPNQKQVISDIFGDKTAWVNAASERLYDLGFNSAGGWSSRDDLLRAEAPLSQTGIMYVLRDYCNAKKLNVSTGGSTDLLHGVLPVFDPEFVNSADATVKNYVSAYKDSPYIYGWMSDNELPCGLSMLDSALSLDISDPRFHYSYAVAWTFMYLKTGKADVSVFDITDELRAEYRAMVYDKYFEVVCDALEEYAPNHQYMGCRFLAGCYKDKSVMQVAGYWCDIITFNYYHAWTPDADLLYNVQKWSGKPFIVTEFYAKGMDVWQSDNRITNKSGAGWTVPTQSDRGKFYQNFVLALMECKGCVGFDWFKYWDNDPDDLTADLSNRNANKGIYSNKHEEYTDATSLMQELNINKYSLIEFFDKR